MDIFELLKTTVDREATDLHLTPGSQPHIRVHGDLVPLGDEKTTPEQTAEVVKRILTPARHQVFEKRRAIDFAINTDGLGRFRVSAYYRNGRVAVAFRRLSDSALDLKELNLPEAIGKVVDIRDGLVLVTGPTGSGKTTTLATLIDMINSTHARNIITIEDPIEYVHPHKKSIVNQRELHTDVDSFADALRVALRGDPDVILVGEMRDLDTIRTAIMAAETGHLVFSTLHSRDAVSSIERMVGVFPAGEQQQIRQQLSGTLKYVISQRLLQTADGRGRVPSVEVMVVTFALANLIRRGKSEQIYSSIETGGQLGMQTMEQSLCELYLQRKIDRDTAVRMAKNPKLIEERLKRTRETGTYGREN